MKKYIQLVSLLIVVSSLMIGCQRNDNEDLKAEITQLKNIIDAQQQQIESMENDIDTFKLLEASYNELQETLEVLKEETTENDRSRDLMDLTLTEKECYDSFKTSYDAKELVGLDPESICSLYIYALFIEDHETVYELYQKDEAHVLWSKEEHFKIQEDEKGMENFDVFKEIYDFKTTFDGDQAHLTWKSKNGYVDEISGPFTYSFYLSKEDDIWRVCYLPMQ